MGGKRGLERAKSAERGDGCVINGRRQRLLQEEKTPGKKQSKGMKKKKNGRRRQFVSSVEVELCEKLWRESWREVIKGQSCAVT